MRRKGIKAKNAYGLQKNRFFFFLQNLQKRLCNGHFNKKYWTILLQEERLLSVSDTAIYSYRLANVCAPPEAAAAAQGRLDLCMKNDVCIGQKTSTATSSPQDDHHVASEPCITYVHLGTLASEP